MKRVCNKHSLLDPCSDCQEEQQETQRKLDGNKCHKHEKYHPCADCVKESQNTVIATCSHGTPENLRCLECEYGNKKAFVDIGKDYLDMRQQEIDKEKEAKQAEAKKYETGNVLINILVNQCVEINAHLVSEKNRNAFDNRVLIQLIAANTAAFGNVIKEVREAWE